MVFFTEKQMSSAGLKFIPPELWFHICKMEHKSKIQEVHNELGKVFNQTRFLNSTLREALEVVDWLDSIHDWTETQLLAIAATRINEDGEEDFEYFIEANY